MSAVIVLVGPTAVGKTAAAIDLAEALGGEIISADSRYLYRGLDIGTAKPTPAEQARARHHLIDVTDPDQPWTLAQYQAAAAEALRAIRARGRVPLLVGGTGQYIKALTEGWVIPPSPEDGAARRELEQTLAQDGLAALVERLRAVDPASAQVVDLQNPRRVIRALEVALVTGESFVAQRRRAPPPFATLTLGLTLPRPELYARIDARVDAMIAAGWVAEVRGLVARGYGWELPALSALGYQQIGLYLQGKWDLAAAIRHIKSATRTFVRRQANWFKLADPQIHWAEARAGVVAQWAAACRAWLESGEAHLPD
jgi:tRNA dimethylallyltransferase